MSTPDTSAYRTLIKRWKDGTFSEVIDDWKWIFGYSARYKGAIFLYILFGILSTTFSLVSAVASKYLIDIITGCQTDKLGLLAVLMVSTSVTSLALESVINRISTKMSVRINNDIQADIFDKIVDADWLAITGYTSGDILNRFSGDVNTVSSNAISWLPTILITSYRFFATLAVIVYYDWVMAVIALAASPVLLVLSRYMLKKQREHNRKAREEAGKLMSFEVEAFNNFDTIKSFGIAGLYSRKLRGVQEKYKKAVLDYNAFTIGTNVVLSSLGLLIQFVTFGYCLFRLWTHAIQYGTMTLFLQQRANFTNAFNSLVGIVPTFLTSSVSAHRIRELVELPREVHIPESNDLDRFAPEGFSVEMEGLRFAYREGTDVIRDSRFAANPGEIVALIGPSGEGKTTMIRLILGLVRPGDGAVVIRSREGLAFPMNAETRHLFAYVPQGNTLISGTVADNLRMVKEDAAREEMIDALRLACAWDFVSKLPLGLDAPVGERGRGFSEGQAQRISIARAILRDAPILLLDEATSALDVATEREVLRNIVTARPNKTCIVTTHRPSVLDMCQRVYRVVDTRVTELSKEESGRMAMDF